MKQKSTKILVILIALILIVGAIMIGVKGLAFELKYQNGKQVEIDLGKEFDIKDMQAITNEVFGKQAVLIEQIEVYKDAANIITTDITEEQKADLVTKINEKYGTELKADSTEIINIPNMKIRDLVKPYVTSFAISTVLILVYIAIRYRKLGSIKTMINSLLIIVVGQVVLFSLIAITRIPVGRLTIPMVLIVYVCTLLGITNCLEKKLKLKKEEKEKNKN